MALSLEDRKKIAKILPRGAKLEISRRISVHRITVSAWFAGRHSSMRVEQAVITYLEEYASYKERVKNALEITNIQ